MSTIVKSEITVKKHVTVSSTLRFDDIEKFIKTTERQYIKSVIGRKLYKSYTEEAPTELPGQEVYYLLEEAICNIALLKYTKVGSVDVTDHGLSINNSQSSKPAEWWQVRDLRRELLKAGTTAIDEALEIMETNESAFSEWTESNGYTLFKELFVRKTSDFQRYFNIESSRSTFLKLRPYLLKTEHKYFESLIGTATMEQIKNGNSDEEKKALNLSRAAQISLTISEITNEGAFLLTPTGLFFYTDEIQGEKKQNLSPQDLYKLHRAKLNDGNAYLRKLVNHLKNNEETFADYAQREAQSLQDPTYNKPSILSF